MEPQETPKEKIVASNKYFWAVGALIAVVFAWFGFKMISGTGEKYRVTLVNVPQEAQADKIATFTWRIDGTPTTINNTTVYLGLTSNPGNLGIKVTPEQTKYTEFVQDFAKGKFDIPLQFVGNHKMGKVGKYYFRVYAVIKGKNYWSPEYSLEVK